MKSNHRICSLGAGAVVAALTLPVSAELLDILIEGSVQTTDLTRGPFVDAAVGDPVSIAFAIDTDIDLGNGDIHIYETIEYTITINDISMTASAVPVFVFSTFVSFHGFENTSTGLLLPGGGKEHNYRVPIFGASGPPEFWLPQGSEPQDHIGVFAAELFDSLNVNTLVDQEAGGPGIDEHLVIAFDQSISIGSRSTPGDIDGDGSVGAADLLILLASWGPCDDCGDCPADLDGNCSVGASDLLILLANWG